MENLGRETQREEVGQSRDVAYVLGYAWPSQAIHTHDADSYFDIDEKGAVRPARPKDPEAAVLPAAAVVLIAMEIIDKFLDLGRKDAVLVFNNKIKDITKGKER